MKPPTSTAMAVIHTALANASLGTSLRLHTDAHVESVLTAVAFPPSPTSASNAESFLMGFQDACHGPTIPNPAVGGSTYRAGSSFLFKTRNAPNCLRGNTGHLSQVISWRNLISLLDASDRLKFGFVDGDKPPASTSTLWAKLQSMDDGDRNSRTFTPKADAYWLWKPVQWWTPRKDVEKLLKKHPKGEWANLLRDRLGLFYDPHNPDGSERARATNMRFLIHIPAEIIHTKGHYRPNFADAGGYNRFATHRKAPVPKRKQVWGRTVDLGVMRRKGALDDGLRERVSPRLSPSDFGTHKLSFDYLGLVTEGCGETPADDDFAFQKSLIELHDKVFPASVATLNLHFANLPKMAP